MLPKPVLRKSLLFGISVGLLCAILFALLFSGIDWWTNYSGLFRDESGTHWDIVYETAESWFLPTFLLVAPLAAAGNFLFGHMKRRKKAR